MEIARDRYVEMLRRRMGNGMIKVITGIRRCGKSYLLFELFYKYLLSLGVPGDHILRVALDDRANKQFRDPDELYRLIRSFVKDGKTCYVLLDEVQYVSEFEDVLNSVLHISNVDAYVTGSHAKFLSKDIITEFRGRGDQIHLGPLSYREFSSAYEGAENRRLREYMLYGGLPFILKCTTPEQKVQYLEDLFTETYIRDVLNRNKIRNKEVLDDLLNIAASSIGSLTNPNKLANTFRSVRHLNVSSNTISEYLNGLEDSFILEKAFRYDVKGKKYIDTPLKYYFTDLGLRNARIGFRQYEETHIMENVIFNDLRCRGYAVDIGNITISEKNGNGNYVRKQVEVDFVCHQADQRFYVQSALSVSDPDKLAQEVRPLVKIDDSFKKIIVVRDPVIPWRTEEGILVIGIEDFLLHPGSLETL